jgi:hypothetical protein
VEGLVDLKEKPDLDLKDLESFSGTQSYYRALGFRVTDGINYVMDNGYSWLVTDTLAVLLTKRKVLGHEPCLVMKFKVTLGQRSRTGDMEISDGDKGSGSMVYHRQHYDYTTARRDLIFYFQEGVLMLAGEY